MDNKVEELAKQLFIKAYPSSSYLNEQNYKHIVSTIKNTIEVAELFYKVLEDETNNRGL